MGAVPALALMLIGLGLAGLACGRRGRAFSVGYLRWLLLMVAACLTLTPFVWLVCAAIKAPEALMGYAFLPPPSTWGDTLSLGNFRRLFSGENTVQGTVHFWTYMLNSLFLASAQTILSLLCCSLTGFALAKYRFRGRELLLMFMLGTMMLPGMLFLAPTYRLLYGMGWLDTWLALLIPSACPAFGIFLFRQAIIQIPDDLLEAARIDGVGHVRMWWQIVMPLVRPMSGAFCLVTFLGAWNSFLGPQIYISSQEKLTLPVVLSQYMGVYEQQYGVFLAGTLLAIIPPAILFISLQREFVAGLTSGAVKG
jgi:multiple sugar transport system permease protein